ncbi:MAG: endonuclease/exonuclease/phosphatase family protein [Saprospirales bacterium]|nr:endonuclease/exonuclease/phosphatase family protein [Saprospirales bacterium]
MKHISIPLFSLIFLFAASTALRAQDGSFRAMTFNIRYDTPDDGINRWDNRKDWVADLIRHYGPEVFGLQEALEHQIEDLAGCLPEWAWVGVGRDDGKKGGEYTPIFYRKDRWKMLESGTYWLSEDPEKVGEAGWDASLPRIVTWMKLQQLATGRTVFLANTHFDHRGTKARQESALLILRRLATLLPTDPIVLMGDLNSLPGSMPYQLLEGSMLSDSRFLCRYPPYGPEGTFNGFQLGAYGARIDYIFVNDFWKVQEYVTIADHLDKRHPSDHFPVMVALSLKPL